MDIVKIRSKALAFSVCALGLVPLASAQAGHEGHAGGPVPREILDRPVPLRQGIGSVHEAVSTSSPEAQAFYDQGLAYEHSFVWIEAARSFHQALRLDPNLAMAYLGLADTYIGLQDVATARAAFQRAKELERKASQRERMWIARQETPSRTTTMRTRTKTQAEQKRRLARRKSICEWLRLFRTPITCGDTN